MDTTNDIWVVVSTGMQLYLGAVKGKTKDEISSLSTSLCLNPVHELMINSIYDQKTNNVARNIVGLPFTGTYGNSTPVYVKAVAVQFLDDLVELDQKRYKGLAESSNRITDAWNDEARMKDSGLEIPRPVPMIGSDGKLQ